MSLFTRNTFKSRPKSPSLESVLSTNGPSTTDMDLGHHEWVIFSPQASESQMSSFEQINDDDADLELPAHNGTGSFPPEFVEYTGADPQTENDSAGSPGSPGSAQALPVPQDHLMDRVSRWSSEQSRLVYEELQRLEHRFLWVNNKDTPQEPKEQQEPGLSWRNVARRVHNLIALDDEVLGILFADDGAITPRAPTPEAKLPNAFDRSKNVHPDWDDQMVRRVFSGLGIKQAPSISLLRKILGWGLEPQVCNPIERVYSPIPRDYWEDECSSLSTGLQSHA